MQTGHGNRRSGPAPRGGASRGPRSPAANTRPGIRVRLPDGREARWGIGGSATLEAVVLRDGVLVGFVPRRWHAFGHGQRFSRRAEGAAHNAMSGAGPVRPAGQRPAGPRRSAETGLGGVGQRVGSRTRRAASAHPAGDRHRNQHHAQRQQNPDSHHDVLLSPGARRMCFVFPASTGVAVGSLKASRLPGCGKARDRPGSSPEKGLGTQRPGVGRVRMWGGSAEGEVEESRLGRD